MDIATIQTTAVNTWLQAVRLPLTSAEVVLRQRDAERPWAPALLFENFEAFVRAAFGTAFENDELLDQARLQRAELEQRKKAAMKRGQAKATVAEADAEYKRRQEELEHARERVEETAEAREAAVERERGNAEERVVQKITDDKVAARQAAAARERSVESQARASKAKELEVKEEALREAERALKAKDRALELEEARKEVKAERKAK